MTMKFCTVMIPLNEDRQKQLEMLHQQFKARDKDLRELIHQFIYNPNNKKDMWKKPYLSNLLVNLYQIEYSFSEIDITKKIALEEIKKAEASLERVTVKGVKTIENLKNDLRLAPAKYVLREQRIRYESIASALTLAFFFNAKSFLELIKTNTKIKQGTDFNELLADITFIRDHFAHSYEKERGTEYLSTGKILVTYKVQTGFLESLILNDAKTGEEIGEIRFSLEAFYFSIRDIFKQVKDNVNLLK